MPLWELPQDWSPEEIHLEEVESDVCQQDQIEHEPNQSPTAAAARIETAVIDDEDSCSDRIPANNPSVGNKPNSSGPIVSVDKTRGKKSKVGITRMTKGMHFNTSPKILSGEWLMLPPCMNPLGQSLVRFLMKSPMHS